MALVGVIGSTPGVQLGVFSTCTSLHVLTRTQLTREALAAGFDALCWFDADMVFPPNALRRLLAHRRTFVAAAYAQRNSWPVKGAGVGSLPEGSGLANTESGGLGVALIRRAVFERTPEPWFAPYWDDAGGYVGEDVAFCHKVRGAGFEIAVDLQLSREVGHLGTAQYALSATLCGWAPGAFINCTLLVAHTAQRHE